MGILSFLFGTSGVNGQDAKFVTEQAFQANLTRQTTMSPETVTALRSHGVTASAELKLEYFFYTNTLVKAEALAEALKNEGYTVEIESSAGDKSLLVITGWTTLLVMNNPTVVSWTDKMTRLGYKHDCEFDGWGTNSDQ